MTSEYYVLFLDSSEDEKQSILHPDVVGPLASREEAESLIQQHPRYDDSADDVLPADGGYASATTIGPDSFFLVSPQERLRDWGELRNSR